MRWAVGCVCYLNTLAVAEAANSCFDAKNRIDNIRETASEAKHYGRGLWNSLEGKF